MATLCPNCGGNGQHSAACPVGGVIQDFGPDVSVRPFQEQEPGTGWQHSGLGRVSEIGLRRALGSTRRQIRGQFLAESVLLSGLGGLVGVVMGIGVTAIYSLSQKWPAVLPPEALVGGVAVAALVGAIAGAYPAMRAARLTPTEALA